MERDIQLYFSRHAPHATVPAVQERRGPKRASNVARLPAKPAAGLDRAAPKVKAAAGGSEGQWEQF